MGYLELENSIKSKIKELDRRYLKAFLIVFGIINVVFLFHTVNFMFGDHDWNYIRSGTYWNEGSFEGRPLHFILQCIFFDGQVLPILNNLLSFALLTIGAMMLAKYWKLPLSTFNYAVFSTFFAVLPYTLVWLYYAKDTLINLSLPLICVEALLCAEKQELKKQWLWHIGAILLMLLSFSSYAAVINLYGVCLVGKILIEYAEGKPFADIMKSKLSTMVDMLVALIGYKIIISLSSLTSDYNTQIVSLDYLPTKLAETLQVMLTQFVTPLPFMEYKFKLLLMLITLLGVCGLIYKAGIKKAPLLIVGIVGMLFASKIAYLIAEERGQILAEMENFAFVPRLDFYGLALIYAFGVRLCLEFYNHKDAQKLMSVLLLVITFMSCVRDVYAQKVWKLGFDAEMKAHERIVSRLEETPSFFADRKYRLLQIGSLALRKNYYRKDNNETTSLDLLETSYTPEFMSRIVYNFYYPTDIFYDNAVLGSLSKKGQDFIRNEAESWPSQKSIYIDGDIVIIVLTEEALEKAKSLLYF